MKGSDFYLQVAARPPFSKLHPSVAAFFKDYLSHEKVISFGDQYVVNTHFPPYPGPAFNQLVKHFRGLGDASERHLYSVTLGVTNRCNFRCWHCYNAGRSQSDIPLRVFQGLIPELQDMGAVMVTLTGGEPLLREDLEDIAGLFDERSCVVVGTTGAGLDQKRADRLRQRGVFAVGISLDSADAAEHDRLRGVPGAYPIALDGLRRASEAGLYPYVVAVATREFLQRDHFMEFMQVAGEAGALEVHLLEPSASGQLAGRTEVLLNASEKSRILDYQREIALREDLPILSSYTYLESSDSFGCGAGLTHFYIDGSGEVCPCQLVPLSFGNVTAEPLKAILDRMGCQFRRPRSTCVGRLLSSRIPSGRLPCEAGTSVEICEKHLPRTHRLPRFFAVCSQASGEVGQEELRQAYDRVHEFYDEFWLSEAAGPIRQLILRLPLERSRRLFEAGCGTGYATALLAGRMQQSGEVLAVDLSEGMLREARRRVRSLGLDNVSFVLGDALDVLGRQEPCDIVFSSWVLGYIPLVPFFSAACRALCSGGLLAFVVHQENSPQEPLEIFAQLVAEDPSVLQKTVAFDFPRDMGHVERLIRAAGLEPVELWEGNIVFRYPTPREALEHLLKSGAGTAFYDAIDPRRRERLTDRFLEILGGRRKPGTAIEVVHDYVSCVARKT